MGVNDTVPSGVTIDENNVVDAGAVITTDVSQNTVVGGVTAKVIK